jgi:hypothetical protein
MEESIPVEFKWLTLKGCGTLMVTSMTRRRRRKKKMKAGGKMWQA